MHIFRRFCYKMGSIDGRRSISFSIGTYLGSVYAGSVPFWCGAEIDNSCECNATLQRTLAEWRQTRPPLGGCRRQRRNQ